MTPSHWSRSRQRNASTGDRHFLPVAEVSVRELVARRLREERKARGVTQKQLADALTRHGLSITESDVRKREKGSVGVKVEELVTFAHVLGVPLVELLAPAEGDDSSIRVGSAQLILRFADVELRGWGRLAYERHGMLAWLRTGSATGEMLANYLRPLDEAIASNAQALDDANLRGDTEAGVSALGAIARVSRVRERERAEPPWSRRRRPAESARSAGSFR
jgi:transcriptional regulator with XRE-family HTH domain